jgi:hypothetical protein
LNFAKDSGEKFNKVPQKSTKVQRKSATCNEKAQPATKKRNLQRFGAVHLFRLKYPKLIDRVGDREAVNQVAKTRYKLSSLQLATLTLSRATHNS